MVSEHDNAADAAEIETPVLSRVEDVLTAVFLGAIRGAMESLPDDAVRRVVIIALMNAHKALPITTYYSQ